MTDEQFKALMDRLDRHNAAMEKIASTLVHVRDNLNSPQGHLHGQLLLGIAESLHTLATRGGEK